MIYLRQASPPFWSSPYMTSHAVYIYHWTLRIITAPWSDQQHANVSHTNGSLQCVQTRSSMHKTIYISKEFENHCKWMMMWSENASSYQTLPLFDIDICLQSWYWYSLRIYNFIFHCDTLNCIRYCEAPIIRALLMVIIFWCWQFQNIFQELWNSTVIITRLCMIQDLPWFSGHAPFFWITLITHQIRPHLGFL